MASNQSPSNSYSETISKPFRKNRDHPEYDTRGKKKFKLRDNDHSDLCHFHREHSLQFLKPYFFNFHSNAKARWFDRSIIDVTCTEFTSRSYEYYAKVINNGRLRLNGAKITNVEVKVKNGDILTHLVHRHEPPVLTTPIEILFKNEDMFVINKPSSIPVHPSGRYHFNTLLNILRLEYGFEDIFSVHRLDRLTSGIMIFARNSKKSRQLSNFLQKREIEKEYVCLVNGKFPDSIMVNEPIKCVSHNIGVCQITCDKDEGKQSETYFQLLAFNGERSLLLCKPRTGRMHQIRVHLQHLGFPIVNDPIYNHPAWELPKYEKSKPMPPEKVEEMVKIFVKQIDQQENTQNEPIIKESSVCKDIRPSKIADDHIMQYPLDYGGINLTQTELQAIYAKLNPNPDDLCVDCHALKNIPQMSMFLHALSYSSPDWEFRTKLPDWAQEFEFDTKSEYKDYIHIKEMKKEELPPSKQ
ncbi:hypothetical protein LOD99_5851 [Oopsacas minuta]|uniref:Pseudouridine synthase n=1 Tax=Oopsacas minuta TaxID=111878 RepID=A0AAV7JNP0_9METZ|nr:hypothetical protein LOD99_5851 [Oopsacas minuta]